MEEGGCRGWKGGKMEGCCIYAAIARSIIATGRSLLQRWLSVILESESVGGL